MKTIDMTSDLGNSLQGGRKKNDGYIYTASMLLGVLELLPITFLFGTSLMITLKASLVALFLIGVLGRSKKFFLFVIGIIVWALVYNKLLYNRLFSNFGIGEIPFLVNSCLCWVYICIGGFFVRYTTGSRRSRETSVLLCGILTITVITTIISLLRYPGVSRNLGNSTFISKEFQNQLYRVNTASWGEIYGFSFSLIALIRQYLKTKKKVYLVIVILLAACIVLSEVTFALIFSMIIIAFMFINLDNKRYNVLLKSGAFLLIISCYIFRAEIMYMLYTALKELGEGTLSKRFYELYTYFEYGVLYGDAEGRTDLYLVSINTFINNPIIGHYSAYGERRYQYIGLHSQIFDALAAMGLCGGIMLFSPFNSIYKRCVKVIRNKEKKKIINFIIFMMIAFNLVNPTYYATQAYYCAFVFSTILMHLE